MTFPNPQSPIICENECYYESLITYFNFAYMTPELADYLRINARSTDTDKDILAILQKYHDIAPYWMAAHNGETQGESAIQPYQQTHSLFQALAQVKKAPRSELIKYLDTPIVPVGDLYYIDNLVAILEATGTLPTQIPGSSTSPATSIPPSVPGDGNSDGRVNGIDFVFWLTHYGQNTSGAVNGDYDLNGSVDVKDYVIWINNY